MKVQSANDFVEKLRMGDPTTCAYQLIYDENDTKYNILSYMDWGYASR